MSTAFLRLLLLALFTFSMVGLAETVVSGHVRQIQLENQQMQRWRP